MQPFVRSQLPVLAASCYEFGSNEGLQVMTEAQRECMNNCMHAWMEASMDE